MSSEREQAFLQAHGYFRGFDVKAITAIIPAATVPVEVPNPARFNRLMILTRLTATAFDPADYTANVNGEVGTAVRIGRKFIGDNVTTLIVGNPPGATLARFPLDLKFLEVIEPGTEFAQWVENAGAANFTANMVLEFLQYDAQILYSGLSLYDILQHAVSITR